jgi:hypothetical protein
LHGAIQANDSAHRWRLLRDSRITNRRCGAAIRCSAWCAPDMGVS